LRQAGASAGRNIPIDTVPVNPQIYLQLEGGIEAPPPTALDVNRI